MIYCLHIFDKLFGKWNTVGHNWTMDFQRWWNRNGHKINYSWVNQYISSWWLSYEDLMANRSRGAFSNYMNIAIIWMFVCRNHRYSVLPAFMHVFPFVVKINWCYITTYSPIYLVLHDCCLWFVLNRFDLLNIKTLHMMTILKIE